MKTSIKPYNMIAEQRIIENGVASRQLKLFQRIPEEDTVIDDSVPNTVFIVYSLPMLPFILVAYVLTLTVGDLIFHLLALVM
jgi:hypothetical protein